MCSHSCFFAIFVNEKSFFSPTSIPSNIHFPIPMNPEELIHKYCTGNPLLEEVLLLHSRAVARKALAIAEAHPELNPDCPFIYEAAMLHDIGVCYTDAPSIHCLGTHPYICHGILGAEILRNEGLPRHARVAERHTGTGLTRQTILEQQLPLPLSDYVPETIEEQIVCFADKFFSKTRGDQEKTPEQVMHSLRKFGEPGLAVFQDWLQRFS